MRNRDDQSPRWFLYFFACFLLNSTQVDFNKDTPKWASSIVGSRLLSKNTPSIYLSESRKASVVGLLYCSSFSRGSRPEWEWPETSRWWNIDSQVYRCILYCIWCVYICMRITIHWYKHPSIMSGIWLCFKHMVSVLEMIQPFFWWCLMVTHIDPGWWGVFI